MLVIVVGLAAFAVGMWGLLKGKVGPIKGRGMSALVTVAGLIVFFVGIGMVAENDSQAKKSASAPTAKQAATAAPSTATQQPSTPSQQATTPAASTEKKEPSLPGLMPADISLNLDKAPYSLKFGDFKKGTTRYQKCGRRDANGETMEVCIDSSNVNDVVFINATVYGSGITSASSLLPFVATVPFDGNDPQKAKAWVLDNLPQLKEGQPVETTIGGVEFTLFGNGKTNANLQIAPTK